MKKQEFDIIIIGAGSGGLNIAGFMNRAGFKTLLIDKKEENIGGDCLNYGCVPSKALIHLARKIKEAKESEKYGLKVSEKVNLKKITDYIKNKKAIFRKHENAGYFRSIGMTVEIGEARFYYKNEIKVNNKIYKAKKIIIATGSQPRIPQVKGIEKVNYFTNENIFDIDFLPENLLVIGAGPIGLELGQAFSHLGSKVKIVNSSDKILPKEDQEIAEIMQKNLEKEGITFYHNCKLAAFKDKNTALISSKLKAEKELNFDAVLIAIGREIKTDHLDLEKARIETENGKIKVNDYLQTSNKNVFLCGDVAGSYQFTHAAELHASHILSNFFSPFRKKLDYKNFSWATFTFPEIASFGLSEKDLKSRNIDFQVLKNDFKEDDRAIIDDYPDSLVKIFVNKNKILGGTMMAPNASELIQELVLANKSGIKVSEIFNKIYAYPVACRINKRTISSLFAKKLESKFNRKLLKWLY